MSLNILFADLCESKHSEAHREAIKAFEILDSRLSNTECTLCQCLYDSSNKHRKFSR